jgi:hypothetical protein
LIGDGWLFYLKPAEQKRALVEAIVECEGRITEVAWRVNYTVGWLHTLIERHRLWPLVNKARIERAERLRREKRHKR